MRVGRREKAEERRPRGKRSSSTALPVEPSYGIATFTEICRDFAQARGNNNRLEYLTSQHASYGVLSVRLRRTTTEPCTPCSRSSTVCTAHPYLSTSAPASCILCDLFAAGPGPAPGKARQNTRLRAARASHRRRYCHVTISSPMCKSPTAQCGAHNEKCMLPG